MIIIRPGRFCGVDAFYEGRYVYHTDTLDGALVACSLLKLKGPRLIYSGVKAPTKSTWKPPWAREALPELQRRAKWY
jgi:hypothetical protein